MLMKTKSMTDATLLLAVGFHAPCKTNISRPDVNRLATFCGVTDATARRWLRDGLPKRARVHLENLLAGDYLPDNWRRRGLKLAHDRVYLPHGGFVTVEAIFWWPFLAKAIAWDKVPPECGTVC